NSKMAHVRRLNFFDLEDGEELVLAQLKERVPFALIELLQIKNVLVEGDRLHNVVHFNGDVVASVDLNVCALFFAHCRKRSRTLIISELRVAISFRCVMASSSMSFSPFTVS